jgi:hypothetical protein
MALSNGGTANVSNSDLLADVTSIECTSVDAGREVQLDLIIYISRPANLSLLSHDSQHEAFLIFARKKDIELAPARGGYPTFLDLYVGL